MCEISIIMPVYNKGKYIEKNIQSIINQTFKDWELIIINDGSTDDTLRICNQFTDMRIKIISVKNGGVSKARNIGLREAMGQYITFVDGDDYLAPDYLMNLYNPQYEMIICGLTKVKDNGEILGRILPNNSGEKETQDIFRDFYKEQMDSGIYGFVAGKMIKRSLLEENNIRFDINITLAEDFEFFIRVYDKITRLYYMQSAGYFYRQETENNSDFLDDYKINFFTQIEIQNSAKKMLLKKNAFGEEEEKIYLQRISNYVYTILLLSKSLDYTIFSERVVQLQKIAPKVSTEVNGFMKYFMLLYVKRKKVLLFILLKLRKIWERTIWKQ